MDNVHIYIAKAGQEHNLQKEYSKSDLKKIRNTTEMADFKCLKFWFNITNTFWLYFFVSRSTGYSADLKWKKNKKERKIRFRMFNIHL